MPNYPTASSDRGLERANRPIQTGRPGALSEAPDELSDDALRHWAALVPDMDREGAFTPADREWLVQLCEDLAQMQELREALARTAIGGLEYTRVSVALDRCAKRALAVSREHNLTPAGRARTGTGRTQGISLLAQFADIE